jgi:hypothetical protein
MSMQLLDRLIEAEHLQQAWKIVSLLQSHFLDPARPQTRMPDESCIWLMTKVVQ